jgi:hypothetical protein
MKEREIVIPNWQAARFTIEGITPLVVWRLDQKHPHLFSPQLPGQSPQLVRTHPSSWGQFVIKECRF